MRIAIIAPGSRGDVEPYLALGQGLQRAGHTVRLVTHEDFEPLVTAHSVDFWPIRGSIRAITQGAEMSQQVENGNFVRLLMQMGQEAERGALALVNAALPACRGVDLILAGVGGLFMGVAMAEKLDLPLLQAYYIPMTPTRAYPSFLLPRLPAPLAALLNRPSYGLARQMLWQAFRPADNQMRRDQLNIRPAPLFGPFNPPCSQGLPILYGYSPAVIPPAPDWGPEIHVTGYWFLDPPGAWTPPAELLAFLEAGPPPVYIGFGSMTSSDPQKLGRLVLDAVQQAGQRAIIQSGWGGLQAAELPADVLMIGEMPFGWLFPRMAAVAHHGGAGTTGAGLRAGAPTVIVPFFGDQPFWGRQVAALGAGPAPLRRQGLTADRLAAAIRNAATDPGMKQRAAALGEQIRQEDGVARAVAVIETLNL